MKANLEDGQTLKLKDKSGIKRLLSNEILFLLICIIIAFLLRLFLIPKESVISSDGVYYAVLGQRLISGDIYGGINAYWSPLYPFLAGLSSVFFQDKEFAGRFVSVIAGALLILPAYFLFINIYGRRVACFGAVLLIFHPLLIASSGLVLTESLYTLIFTTGILTAWYALRKGNLKYFFLTGIIFGAAYLTKPEAIGFIVLLFFLASGAKLLYRKFSFRLLVSGQLLLLLGFAICFMPYVFIVHQKTGQWTISQKVTNNISAVDTGVSKSALTDQGQTTWKDKLMGDAFGVESQQENQQERQQSENLAPSSPHYVDSKSSKFSLDKFAIKTAKNLKKEIREFLPKLLPYPLLLFMMLSFLFKPQTKLRAAKEIYLLSFFLCTLFGYAVSVIEVRYLYAIVPILICWTAHGIIKFVSWISKQTFIYLPLKLRFNILLPQIFVLFFSVILLIMPFLKHYDFGPDTSGIAREKKAGLWIKAHKTSPSLIMAIKPIGAFYAEEKHIFLPNEEFSTVLDYAKRRNVKYIFIIKKQLKKTPKLIVPNEEDLPQELKLVYKDEESPVNQIYIYQLD